MILAVCYSISCVKTATTRTSASATPSRTRGSGDRLMILVYLFSANKSLNFTSACRINCWLSTGSSSPSAYPPKHPLQSPKIMSAVRALRQLTGSSSRVFATRAVTRASLSRAVLPSFRSSFTPLSTRAFSVSARRFGEGASTFIQFYDLLQAS